MSISLGELETLGLADRDKWRTRAEEAEARVKELEEELKERAGLVRDLLSHIRANEAGQKPPRTISRCPGCKGTKRVQSGRMAGSVRCLQCL